MPRITFRDVKASRIPAAIGLCPTDSRLVAYINEAQEMLLNRGLWWGCYGKYRICTEDGCITLPPQIATLETAALDKMPIPVRDQWFEFLENGLGIRNGSFESCGGTSDCSSGGGCGISEAVHRGYFPSFKDIVSGGKKLKFVCDLSADVGAEVLALGFDDNNNWIRTNQGGTIKDGEIISLAQGAGTISTNYFSSLTGIQFLDSRSGTVWLYEYRVSDANNRMIGLYEYFETNPHYARYLIPSIRQNCSSSTDCTSTAIDIMGKLEHIPVARDEDFLVISSIPALKFMCVALKNSEQEADVIKKNQVMQSGLVNAMSELDKQLSHYRGQGVTPGINIIGSSVGFAAEPIQNLI